MCGCARSKATNSMMEGVGVSFGFASAFSFGFASAFSFGFASA